MSTPAIRRMLPLLLLLAAVASASAAGNEPIILNQSASGTVWLPFFSQGVASVPNNNFPITSYGTTVSLPGITFRTVTGQISAAPHTPHTYPGTLTPTKAKGTSTATMTITIGATNFVGFRLPDFLTTASSPNNPMLMLQMGANGTTTAGNRFNATLEVNAGTVASPIWVPYNHFA